MSCQCGKRHFVFCEASSTRSGAHFYYLVKLILGRLRLSTLAYHFCFVCVFYSVVMLNGPSYFFDATIFKMVFTFLFPVVLFPSSNSHFDQHPLQIIYILFQHHIPKACKYSLYFASLFALPSCTVLYVCRNFIHEIIFA